MLKRISLQIFTHSSGGTATVDASGHMDATKDASAGASFDRARRASTSISVARPSIDTSVSTTTTPTKATALTESSSIFNVAKPTPSRSSPPPSYLLDDDPFANLIPMTGGTRHRPSFSVGSTSSCIPRSQRPPPIHPELVPGWSLPAVSVGLQTPKSRLQDSHEAGANESDKVRRSKSQEGQKEAKGKKEESKRKRSQSFFVTMSAPVSPTKSHFSSKVPVPPLPTNSEAMSEPSSPKLPSMFGAPPPTTKAFAMTRMQPRPAHQRPAFASRPSLPSLDTLAKTNIVLTKKVKKGRVGAGLPFEPWDNLPEDDQQPYTAPHKHSTPPMLSIPANIPMQGDAADIDRTPTSTPFCVSSASPTRSSSFLTRSSTSLLATPPPQPFHPSQTVALSPLVEDLETDNAYPFLWPSPQLAPSTFKPDEAVPPHECSSPNMSNNFVESHLLAAPVALLPSVPEASILRSLDAGSDILPHSDTDSDRNSIGVSDDENGYFNGDLLDDCGVSYTPEPEPEFHNSRRYLTDRSDDPEASPNKEQQLRWSVATHDSYAESQPHSPSSSNSYAGSVSDLSSGPSYPPSYSFGFGGGSDRDSMTDVSRHLSLSRSISSTSISTSSIGDDIESNINFKHFRSRSASASDSGQGADLSQSVYDHDHHHHHHLLLRSSALIVSSDSGTNSILHSPESEWAFLTRRIHPSYIPDMLVDPALQKLSILPLDNSAADYQTQCQFDSDPESKMPIIQNFNQDDAQETIGSQQNCHAVAHDVFDASLATPVDLIPTSSASKPVVASVLKRHQESLSLVEPVNCLATPSDQSSPPHILAETFRSRVSLSTLNPSEHLHLESEPDDLHEMNGTDKRLREKMAPSRQHSHWENVNGSSAPSAEFPPTNTRRDSKSDEEERLRRMKLLQMRRGDSFQPSSEGGDDRAIRYHGPSRSTDIGPTSGARSTSRNISRTPSAVTSSSHPQQFPSTLSMSSTSEGEDQNSSDDDIPLAQRIPSALTAQQSIRKQVNEEREARRAAREKRRRERQVTLRPAGAGVESMAVSTSQDLHIAASLPNPNIGNALTATGSVRQRSGSVHHRQKTQVMPNMPLVAHGEFGQAFKPEDLARKLQNVKMIGEPPAVSNMRSQAQINKLSRSVSSASQPKVDYPIFATTSVSPAPRLISKRSFHAPEVEHQPRAVSPHDNLPPRKRSISMSRGTSRRGHEELVPPLPNTTLLGRTNLDDNRDRERKVLVKSHADSKITSPERLQHNIHDAPVGGVEGLGTTKHRIFIHNLQNSHVVDIRMDTSAGDLITSLETEGVLDGWAGLGGWMVWEIAQDFGMERPVRSYELLSDVQVSWMTEKTVNFFLLKKSSLSSHLDRSAIPSSAPTHSGWVEWEAKRGKWSKRWLRLKENCLYVSKKDRRDETLLCSLSNFDAYYITRSHRAPKPFAFTIKSTDKLSFFENTADYMHTFSCSEKDGEVWVEKILLARSYVLHQERTALFHPKGPNNATNMVSTLSRSGTKKTIVTKLHQPLVNLASDDIFEPGSLLSKK